MSDLIDRDRVIEAIEGTDWYHQNRNKDMVSGANDDEHQAWYKADDIYKALESIPSADRPQGEWIPCSERLPKGQGYYICTCKDGPKYKRATVVKWSNGWQLTGSRAYWVVVAWMPLPEPWKGADYE